MIDEKPRAIIIGNSPSVLNYEYGEYIDSFDIVIRCNWYKIKNFEKHVGTKTSIWSFAAGTEFVRILNSPTDTHYLEKEQDPHQFNELWIRHGQDASMKAFRKKYPDLKYKQIPPSWKNYCIGLASCKFALKELDVSEVWSFGNTFYLEKNKKGGTFHYYDIHKGKSELDRLGKKVSESKKENQKVLNNLPVKILEKEGIK